jgi:hypothetical protein
MIKSPSVNERCTGSKPSDKVEAPTQERWLLPYDELAIFSFDEELAQQEQYRKEKVAAPPVNIPYARSPHRISVDIRNQDSSGQYIHLLEMIGVTEEKEEARKHNFRRETQQEGR